MPDSTSHEGRRTFHPIRTIALGGLVAGAMDLTAACVVSGLKGRSPVRVMHSIASGLLGAKAYDGGAATAALGVVLHFVIATGATAVYFLVSRKWRFLVRRPWIAGPLYGIAVYAFMNFVVLPASAVPFKLTFPMQAVITGLAVHVTCVGLPIALVVSRRSERHA